MMCPSCGFANIPGAEVCEKCTQDLTQLDQPTAHDRVEQHLLEDPVRALSLRKPISVRPTTTVGQAIEIMLQHNIGAVLVIDESGTLVGILSERDLLTRVAGVHDDYATLPVTGVMTPKPQTVSSDDRLAFAAHQMTLGGYRHIPVLTDGVPSGVISIRDMIRYITRIGQER